MHERKRTRAAWQMRQSWDRMARTNAAYYVCTGRQTWEEEAFHRSGVEAVRETMARFGVHDGGLLVEVGCGLGRMTIPFSERFDWVVGVDVSQAMLEKATQRCHARQRSNIALVRGDGTGLQFLRSGCADVLFSCIVLQHIPVARIVENYIREFGRVTRPGGRVVFQIPIVPSSVAGYTRALLKHHLLNPVSRLLLRATWIPLSQVPAFRGSRLSMRRLRAALLHAGLAPISIRSDGNSWRAMQYTYVDCQVQRRR